MLNVAICDDENAIVNQIEKCILDLCQAEKISIDTDVFYSGASLEQAYLSEKRYDLIFLDIQMENINGISAAKKIRELDENVLIVFVSGYEKYMKELFQYDVFHLFKNRLI
ncbi:MAG: response regulator [Lachnospiraceae bacterium]|nr:response regulator [Lachnospiraceae bacterium]